VVDCVDQVGVTLRRSTERRAPMPITPASGSLKVVQERLGHSTISMTADTMAICSRAETIDRSWRLLSAYCLVGRDKTATSGRFCLRHQWYRDETISDLHQRHMGRRCLR
jgi:hypothetical protein